VIGWQLHLGPFRHDRRTQRTRWKIDAALETKIALEGLREHATVVALAQRIRCTPKQIYAWEKQFLDQAARAFESGSSEGAAGHEREIEKLHAKIGQLTPCQRMKAASNRT
jgi:transposase